MLGLIVGNRGLEGIELAERKTTTLTCQACQGENERPLPYDMVADDHCGACGEPLRSGHAKFVPQALRKAAGIYEERNKLYGDNYKNFGKVFAALFPEGLAQQACVVQGDEVLAPGETKVEYYNRVGILVQVVAKLTRYCANFDRGGHADSLDDLAVYAMMLKELDSEGQA